MSTAKEFKLKNGVVIPAVGYGSYLATREHPQTVSLALEAGYRYIDTAKMYRNEEDIGKAIAQSGIRREDIFLCSKVWPTELGREKTLFSFEESCRKLGTDYLDMFLIHWPKNDPNDTDWLEKVRSSWGAMEELYEQGRIRAIGVSNFLPHHLMPLLMTARITPMVDQLELHVGYAGIHAELSQRARHTAAGVESSWQGKAAWRHRSHKACREIRLHERSAAAEVSHPAWHPGHSESIKH